MDQSGFWDKVIEDEIVNLMRMNKSEFWDIWDKVLEGEIVNLRSFKFGVDVEPLEIIDEEDDGIFIINAHNADAAAAAAVDNINQIDLVIHILNHDTTHQYWSLKSEEGDSQSSCHQPHHRDRHHLRDDDVDEEMILIACQPTVPPEVVTDKLFVDLGGVFASNYDHQNVGSNQDDDDAAAIMSLLSDVDALYELDILRTYEQLEELKRCITQHISEAKPAIINHLMAKPPPPPPSKKKKKKTLVRIRVHLGTIEKSYYANSAGATLATAHNAVQISMFAEQCGLRLLPDLPHPRRPVPSQILYDAKRASRSSKEALETKTFDLGDLITPSSSCCPICSVEFGAGLDHIKKMPCSHVFHSSCLVNRLLVSNACPLCLCELPAWKPPKKFIRYF